MFMGVYQTMKMANKSKVIKRFHLLLLTTKAERLIWHFSKDGKTIFESALSFFIDLVFDEFQISKLIFL